MSESTLAQDLGLPQSAKDMIVAMTRIYGYEMSQFEAALWASQILDVYDEAQIVKACIAHMEGPAPERNFMPKYGTIKSLIDVEPSFVQIERLVLEYGPYNTPDVGCPVIAEAISLLGGWERVCAELPDSRVQSIDFNQYLKRAQTAIATARKRVMVQGISPKKLLGITDRVNETRKTNLMRLENNNKALQNG